MILRINDRFRNREIRYFESYSIELKYDAVASTFQLDYLFDPDNVEDKEFSCLTHYHEVTLHDQIDGKELLLLSGYAVNNKFRDSIKPELAHISGYSFPGILENCQIPPKKLPDRISDVANYIKNGLELAGNPGFLQSDGLTLREIIDKNMKIFRLDYVIDSSVSEIMESKYEQSDANEKQSVKSYFAKLLNQKNIIMTHDAKGRLIFTKATKKQPTIYYDMDRNPIISGMEMELNFNGEGFHSHIFVFGQQEFEEEAQSSEGEIANPIVPILFRPRVESLSSKSDDELDAQKYAENLRAQELKNLSFTIKLDRNKFGNTLLFPGDIISVRNKKVYLYNKTDWFVESVSIKEDSKEKTTTLHCVLPECYTGETPINPFRGINLHAQ